jgi:hypothetical protein
MPTLVWIALGLGAWTFCALLAVAVACAARRGDRLSNVALMGVDPSIEVAPRPRMAIDVTPVTRPWVAAGASPVVASVLAESAG